MTVQTLRLPRSGERRFWPRLGLALTAVMLIAALAGVIGWWLGLDTTAPTRNPFGMGLREAPPSGPLGPYILSIQSNFYRSLQAALGRIRTDGSALSTLLLIGLAYGVFHAAGPGHGKSVISAYLMADEKALRKGLALSLAAALVQALVAIGIVAVMALVLKATASAMNALTVEVETASFAFVALLGVVMTWRKAGKMLGVAALARDPLSGAQDETCDHVHLPPPEELDRLTRWRDMAGVALAAGIRPCAGALVVLVFALSQGLFMDGIAATFAMSLGTAITTGLIAVLAVFAKSFALRVAGGRGAGGALAMAGIELLAAAFVVVLGASLLLGLWNGGA